MWLFKKYPNGKIGISKRLLVHKKYPNGKIAIFLSVSSLCVCVCACVFFCRNYYDTLAQVFGEKGVSAQLPALLKALPQNKQKLLQDVVTGLSKK